LRKLEHRGIKFNIRRMTSLDDDDDDDDVSEVHHFLKL